MKSNKMIRIARIARIARIRADDGGTIFLCLCISVLKFLFFSSIVPPSSSLILFILAILIILLLLILPFSPLRLCVFALKPSRLPRRRHAMTLIELLVAIGLVAIVLSSLLGLYYQVTKMNGVVDSIRKESFQLRFAQHRLSQVLGSANSEGSLGFQFYTDEASHSCTKGQSLVFTYDNGVNIYPWFSNQVLGRLYIDDHGRLCLATWPLPRNWEASIPPVNREIILEDVDSLELSFFMPPSVKELPVESVDPVQTGREVIMPEKGQWHSSWKMAYRQLPPLMKIKVTRTSRKNVAPEALTFAWSMHSSKQTILYTK